MTIISDGGHDKLLVANNLSDNVVLLDPATEKVLQTFDLEHKQPGAVVLSLHRRRFDAMGAVHGAACGMRRKSPNWISPAAKLFDGSSSSNQKIQWLPVPIRLQCCLSADEKTLYVALSNADQVAAVSTADGTPTRFFSTAAPAQKYAGSYPTALAQSEDGKYLFAADSSLDAVAVFDLTQSSAGQQFSAAAGTRVYSH